MLAGLRQRLPAAFLLLAAALFFSAIWWPGHMSSDFLTMYSSALQGRPGDFHAPGFVLFFELLLPLGAGPGWVLFWQVGGLLLAFFLLLRIRFSRVPAALIAIVLLALPMTLGYAGSLSRDVWFAEGMLLTFAFAATIYRHEGRRTRIFLTVCAGLSILIMLLARQNGLFAVAPAALAVVAAHRPAVLASPKRTLIALAGGTVAAAVSLLALQAFMYTAFDVERQHPETALYLYDLAAMHELGADVELPASIRNLPMDEVVAKGFVPAGMSGLVWSADPPARFPATDEERDELSTAWRKAALSHPITYLRARARQWTLQIAVKERAIFIYHPQLDPNTLGLATRWPNLEKRANSYIRWFAQPNFNGSALHDVWIYLVIAGLALWRLWPREGIWRIAALLGAASLMYQVGIFLLAPVAEYRFEYASVVAGLALLPLLLRQRAIEAEPDVKPEPDVAPERKGEPTDEQPATDAPQASTA